MDDIERNLTRIADLVTEDDSEKPGADELGRSWWTRTVDAMLKAVRVYFPPLHLIGVVLTAIVLFIYARLVAITTSIITKGESMWPNFPIPCVLAVWHGCAPSLLVALAARRPRSQVAIMVSQDPRGDLLALLCRLLGLRVARGDSRSGGWQAIAQLAREIKKGGCVVITADGGGPAGVAKTGAVALSSATGAPLIPVGADCNPAITERHKWDAARNPVPFGRIAIVLGEQCTLPVLTDSESIDRSRSRLQDALDNATSEARDAL